MNVRNVHERVLDVPACDLAVLLDGLASPDDALWPRHLWPAMKFDRPLQVGAVGGHGPIRYTVEAYEPGRRIRFRFTAPRSWSPWVRVLRGVLAKRRDRAPRPDEDGKAE